MISRQVLTFIRALDSDTLFIKYCERIRQLAVEPTAPMHIKIVRRRIIEVYRKELTSRGLL